MTGIIRRVRSAWHATRAVSAYGHSRYADALKSLQALQALAPLSLADHVLLANALAGDGRHESAANEYTACMKRSAQKADPTSSFAFAYAAYMRATVTGDEIAKNHFGQQLAHLQRPDAFRFFVNPEWLP